MHYMSKYKLAWLIFAVNGLIVLRKKKTMSSKHDMLFVGYTIFENFTGVPCSLFSSTIFSILIHLNFEIFSIVVFCRELAAYLKSIVIKFEQSICKENVASFFRSTNTFTTDFFHFYDISFIPNKWLILLFFSTFIL